MRLFIAASMLSALLAPTAATAEPCDPSRWDGSPVYANAGGIGLSDSFETAFTGIIGPGQSGVSAVAFGDDPDAYRCRSFTILASGSLMWEIVHRASGDVVIGGVVSPTQPVVESMPELGSGEVLDLRLSNDGIVHVSYTVESGLGHDAG